MHERVEKEHMELQSAVAQINDMLRKSSSLRSLNIFLWNLSALFLLVDQFLAFFIISYAVNSLKGEEFRNTGVIGYNVTFKRLNEYMKKSGVVLPIGRSELCRELIKIRSCTCSGVTAKFAGKHIVHRRQRRFAGVKVEIKILVYLVYAFRSGNGQLRSINVENLYAY